MKFFLLLAITYYVCRTVQPVHIKSYLFIILHVQYKSSYILVTAFLPPMATRCQASLLTEMPNKEGITSSLLQIMLDKLLAVIVQFNQI